MFMVWVSGVCLDILRVKKKLLHLNFSSLRRKYRIWWVS